MNHLNETPFFNALKNRASLFNTEAYSPQEDVALLQAISLAIGIIGVSGVSEGNRARLELAQMALSAVRRNMETKGTATQNRREVYGNANLPPIQRS